MSTGPWPPHRAVAADAAALGALARAAYGDYVGLIGVEPQPMAADWSHLLTQHEVWMVAGPDGPAASLVLIVEPDCLYVWSVAVAPGHQHRGLGRRLMAFAEDRASVHARRTVRLFTHERMTRNIALYTCLGYVETHRQRLAGRVGVHMVKQIGP
ncbi:MAG: N-acetyltransferase [Alphaproteobacteria bacterium]|nr:N-acetyltransferase [Alphaproteobacteria bacterium]